MDNKLKSKTRLAAIQILAQQLINNQDIENVKEDFDKYYRDTSIDDTSEKVQYSIKFLSKLIFFFKKINYQIVSQKIDKIISFDRKFEKWDTIIQAIILIAISEIKNSEDKKMKIILNDYINISKSFVNIKETKLINSILDKLVNEK
ncbi:MAG: transcription antitermination factor NusB [Alphaproteobacteria bacterium]